ncbi:MAG: alkaline phosphatase family protein, partial [Candidatus Hydrothermae bacterium]|nr:alkaline phosphatase family protein [Candidatus Hydrothermae bacterium]
MKKLFVIGLDCAEPSLVYERWNDDLPNLRRLMEEGGYGRMRSTIPPITVPAWATMVSGKDPGELGFYGFRNRKDYTYDKLFVVNSLNFKAKAIWDYLEERNMKSIALGVPPSYPPKRINGIMISGFLTPSAKSEYAY